MRRIGWARLLSRLSEPRLGELDDSLLGSAYGKGDGRAIAAMIVVGLSLEGAV
jgi:hypothetical protein